MKINNLAVLALGLAASAVAQTTTAGPVTTPSGKVISITIPGELDDGGTWVASLIGSDVSRTTLALGCADGNDDDSCPFATSATFTAGPTTLIFSADYDGTYQVTQGCSFNSNGGVCSLTAPAIDGTPTSGVSLSQETTTISFGSESIRVVPVTVTAGATGNPNDANPLAPGGMAAALMGIAAVLL